MTEGGHTARQCRCCEEFGRRLYAEAWRRGWARADKKVVLGDGSEWIWNQAALHFPDAIHIVDLYHSAAEPQPKHFGKLSAVSAQLSALGHKCIADILLQSAK